MSDHLRKPAVLPEPRGHGEERQAIDFSALRALIGDDEVAARAILRSFSTHSSGLGNQLRAALAAGQPALAVDAAHKLKSAARAIGAFALADLCADIERAGEKGETTVLAATVTLLIREEASVAAVLALREQDNSPLL
jgi:two-component system sensor histidine kinase/response regulator